jgi:hypothetical protein
VPEARSAPQANGGSRHGARIDGAARQAILAEVATLYWIDKLNQEQIARQIGRSVPTVSRLLAEADATGIVEVRIRYPSAIDPALQAELIHRYGLHGCSRPRHPIRRGSFHSWENSLRATSRRSFAMA